MPRKIVISFFNKGNNKIASGVQLEGYSVEDQGRLSFNVFCYNVQPGIDIDYTTGDNEVSDNTLKDKGILPFAVSDPNENNPDLIFEMNKHISILFEDQKNSNTYITMTNKLAAIASDARSVGESNDSATLKYIKLKKCQYDYVYILKNYIPKLLAKEEFFNSTFR